jgi:RNA polymerase sigma-70 factor (ECF subfamily)
LNITPSLLKACKKRDRLAQSQLYQECFGLLMGVCVRYVKDDGEAKALLNAGFLKILTKLDSYKSHVPFEAWIRRIMINTIIDQYRRDKKYKEHMVVSDLEDGVSRGNSVDYNYAEQHFDAEELMEFVRQLPAVSQQVFNLFAIDGYSHKEISKMLGISTGTSKWHVSYARKTVIGMIEKKMKPEKKLAL